MATSGQILQHYKWTSYDRFTTTTVPAEADLTITCDWSVLEQSVPYNYSKVKFKVQMKCYTLSHVQEYLGPTSKHDTIRISSCYINIDSDRHLTMEASEALLTAGKTVTLLEGDTYIYHNSGGDKSPVIKLNWNLDRIYEAAQPGNYISMNKLTLVQSVITLDTIVRRALLWSAPTSFTDEDSPVLSYSVPEGMTGYIYLSMDGMAGAEDTHPMAVTGEGTATYVFNANDKKKLWSIQDQGITKDKPVKFFIRSTTTVDNVTFREGAQTGTSKLSIINYMPTFNEPEVYDTNQDVIDRLTGNKYILVRYVSNAYFDTHATGNKGATIESQSVRNGETTLPGPTGTFEKLPSNEFHMTATDNYGRTVQETMAFTRFTGFIDYVKLTCNVQITEMTAEGVATVRVYGKFYDGTFGAIKNKQNRLRVNYDLYTNGSDDFDHIDIGYADLELNGSSWSVNGKDYEYIFQIKNLDYQSYYTVAVRVSDEVAVQGVAAQTLLAATPIFDWGRRDFNFNVPVIIQGWEVDRVVEEGSESGYYEDANGIPQSGGFEWNFRKWSSGLLECWCSLPITTNVSTAWGGLYTSGRLIKTNILFPREFTEPPVVTATLAAGYAGGILMTTGSSSKPVSKYAAGTLEIARGTSYSNASYTIHYMVKGRWK